MDSNHRIYISQARVLLSEKKIHSAFNLLCGLLKHLPNNQEVIQLFSLCCNFFSNKYDVIELLDRCIKEDVVSSPIIYYELGSTYLNIREYKKATDFLIKAIELEPNYFEALHDLGAAFALLGNRGESLKYFLRAAQLNNQSEELFYNLGRIHDDEFRYKEAIDFYQRATLINPRYTDAWINLAIDLAALKRYEEALDCFSHARKLNPKILFLFGDCLFMRMRMCEWSYRSEDLQELTQMIKIGEPVIAPFALMALIDSPVLNLKAAQIYARSRLPHDGFLGPVDNHLNKKIRVGYFSADFHEHPVSYLTAELFELHDRSKFEVYGFSFGGNPNDLMRKRLASSFDHFLDVTDKNPLEICQISRDHSIDIAIDLSGFTENARPEIFAFRAAPIQISYIGYLGTMGANYIDYLIADEVIIPPDLRQFYAEKIIYLPSYQSNDSKRKPSNTRFTRLDFGINEDQFVFCNLNNTYKIAPEIFGAWMKILNSVQNSVLLLYAENTWATENLSLLAYSQGINPKRLIFLNRIPRADYLARYSIADLFLDTFPYNAGATASDALWMGLPVLTLQGSSFCSRVASSLLTQISLPEMITYTLSQYEAFAIKLGTHPSSLKSIKEKLQKNKLSENLFNTKLFVKYLESAYEKVHTNHEEGLSPEDLCLNESDKA